MESKTTGRNVFITPEGTDYLLNKYLSDDDRVELRSMNDGFHDAEFVSELESRIVRKSGGRNFIPSNYEAELVENSKALIGSKTFTRKLKTVNRNVDVIETFEGKTIYQDANGRFRDLNTGRFTKPID